MRGLRIEKRYRVATRRWCGAIEGATFTGVGRRVINRLGVCLIIGTPVYFAWELLR